MYAYIETKDGKVVGTSHTLEYMKKVFPDHDFNVGPPSGYSELVETPRPYVPRFHKIKFNDYVFADGKFYDNLELVPMTEREKELEIGRIKHNFYRNTGYNSWTYNEALELFEPPFQPPNPVPGGSYKWDEASQTWILINIKETPGA